MSTTTDQPTADDATSPEVAHTEGEVSSNALEVALPLVAMLVAILIPVALVVIAANGGGLVAVVFGVLAVAAALLLVVRATGKLLGPGDEESEQQAPGAGAPPRPVAGRG